MESEARGSVLKSLPHRSVHLERDEHGRSVIVKRFHHPGLIRGWFDERRARTEFDALLELAARPETTPEVRAAVFAQLSRLRADLRARHASESAAEAHLRLAERDLSDFLERPESRRPRGPKPPPPPGRPIGSKAPSR